MKSKPRETKERDRIYVSEARFWLEKSMVQQEEATQMRVRIFKKHRCKSAQGAVDPSYMLNH